MTPSDFVELISVQRQLIQKITSVAMIAVIVTTLLPTTLFPQIAEAVTCSTDDTVALTTFDTFSLGSVDTQNDWSSTGPFDQGIVANTYGFADFGCQSLRISNAVTSGSFGNQTFAAPTAVETGESSVASKDHFEAQFDVASTLTAQQPGLFISVSPDDGNGSRMSYLGFSDETDGIHVIFYDATNSGPLSSTTVWNDTDVATLDRNTTHTVKFTIDFVDGPGNDVVKIYINGSLVHTGTSWEDYYRYDSEQSGNGNVLFGVDTLIFRSGGTAYPTHAGNGFLFDNISLEASSSDTTAPDTPVHLSPADGVTLPSTSLTEIDWTDATDPSTPVTYYYQSSHATSTNPDGSFSSPTYTSGALTTSLIPTSGTPNGVYYWHVRAQDSAGNSSDWTDPWKITVADPVPDTTRPTLTFDEPDADSYHGGVFQVSLSGSDSESGLEQMVVNFYDDSNTLLTTCGSVSGLGGIATNTLTCSLNADDYPEGVYVLKGGAFDAEHNNKTITRTIHFDHTRPVLVFNTPDSGDMLSGSVAVQTEATDPAGIASMVINIKDGANSAHLGSCGSGNHAVGGITLATYDCTLDTTTYADGDYYFRAGTNDTAGNNKTISQPFSIDNTKPDVTMTMPTNGSTQVGTFSVLGTATDAGSGIDYVLYTVTKITGIGGTYVSSIDNGTTTYSGTTEEWEFDVNGLSDGFYRLKVQAFDAAGNWKYKYHDVEVVNLVPVLTITRPATSGDYATSTHTFTAQYDNAVTATIQWAIRAGASCSGSSNTVAGNVDGHHDASLLSGSDFTTTLDTTLWPDGEYCFIVNPKEPSGLGYDDLRATQLFMVDNTAPDAPALVSPLDGATVNGLSVTQEWSDTATDTARYIYESYNDDAASSLRWHAEYTTLSKTAHNVADTIFWWRVQAADNAGNISPWSELWKLIVDSSAVSPSGDTYAHLTLVKQTADGSDNTFDLTIADGSATTTVALTTSGGVATSTTYDLAPGSYSILETEQANWLLSDVSCTSDMTPSVSEQTNGVVADLVVGEHMTCTFTSKSSQSEDVLIHRGDLATSFTDVLTDPSLWFFYNDETDEIDNSLGWFINGPSPTPLGEGSAQLSVTGTERRNIATYRFHGTPLSEITALQFSTYNPSAGNGGSANRSAYLNFNVDFDGTDTWQKRIAFVPNKNGSVVQDTWQTWNAVDGGSGMWWWSGFASNSNQWPDGNTSEYRSWSDLVSAFPSISIRESDGWLGLRVGEPYSDGYTEYLDRFFITIDDGTSATTTTFDFEPDVGTQTTITNATDLADNSSTVGDAYTVQWSVAPSSGASTPTGTVFVTVNGGTGCSAAALTGECSVTPSFSGTVILQANFVGDPGYDDSQSSVATHEIVESFAPSAFGGANGPLNFGFVAGGGSVLGASTSTKPTGNFGQSCSQYVSGFLGYGRNNDSEQVTRLQYVLGTIEGFTVQQTGVFDLATLAAVKAFQTRYANDILEPWGLTEPTGYVYFTTRKKVNELFCGGSETFPLTLEQQAMITNTQRNKFTPTTGNGSGTSNGSTGTTTQTNGGTTTQSTSTSPTPTNASQVGAAGSSIDGNIFQRFFNWIFGGNR